MPIKAFGSACAVSALALVLGCSSSDNTSGSGGTGPVASGGMHSNGGSAPVVTPSGGTGPVATGGSGPAAGGSGGGSAPIGVGGSSSGGAPSLGGSGGSAPVVTAGGGTGGRSSGGAGGAGGSAGANTGGPPGTFDPCPASEPCKILPLGDSITWGINYGGGYRIKLFTHTSADNKKITFLGYDTANPPSAAVLSALGTASSSWVGKHEGHSGWTIQQDDDLVTGKSTATNDSVNYKGKKVVADFSPNIVLIHLGTNDMYQTPAGAPDRLGTLIDHVVADAPNALVVVSSIIPFPSGAAAVDTFNKAVPGVVKTRTDAGKHVIYVDMFAALKTSDLGSDMVHPNEGGYEKMAVVWYNAIKPYLH